MSVKTDFLLGEFFQISTKPENMLEIEHQDMKLKMENSKRNQDILLSGGKFLMGSRYELAEIGEKREEPEKPKEEKLQKKEDRYFTDKSTTRCRKCKQFGHMSMDCPNDSVNDRVCIYCGEGNHIQFDCPNRLCFKCNQPGHKAYECSERFIKKCFRCEEAGHKAENCVIIPTPINQKEKLKMVCIQCRRQGHAICDLPKKPLNIDWGIISDYAELKKSMLKKIQAANEDILLSGGTDSMKLSENLDENPEDGKLKSHKISKLRCEEMREKKAIYLEFEKKSQKVFCCYCGDNHYHTQCRKKSKQNNIALPKYNSEDQNSDSKNNKGESYKKLVDKYRNKEKKHNNNVGFSGKHKKFDRNSDNEDDYADYNDRIFDDELTKGNKYHKRAKY